MGRGGRDNINQALNIRSLPRQLRSPQRIGQRRYSVNRRDLKDNNHKEPGYLRAAFETGVGQYNNILTIEEEIACQGNDGKLHWLPYKTSVADQASVTDQTLHGVKDIAQYRKLANDLNKNPLGPIVVRDVEEDGQLGIGSGVRKLERGFALSRKKDYKTYIEMDSPKEYFDITDPDQAKAAAKLHSKLSAQVEEAHVRSAQQTATELRILDKERASKLLGKTADDEKIKAKKDNAKRFAQALENGTSEQFQEELEVKEAKVNEQEQKKVASRMQQTLTDLAGS